MKWTKKEDDLLISLRKRNIPYREKVKMWEEMDGFPSRSQDALRNRMNYLRNLGHAETEKEEILGVLDIETSHFKADIGYMLSWAIYYPRTGETSFDVIKKREVSNYTTDKRICKSLVKELRENVDVLLTFNGERFDNDFARTRCLMHGHEFPIYGEKRHKDVYQMARGKLATHRKTLKAISEMLDIDGKTPVKLAVWRMAMLGHPESLEEVLEHNIADVEITWKVYDALKKFSRHGYKSI